MHVLFGSTVFFIGLPCDSTRTIKGLVKVLCLIPSCIAKLVTSTVLKFCNSHPSLPLEALLLFLINTGSPLSFAFGLSLAATSPSFDFNTNFYINLIVFQHVPAELGRSADKIKFLEQNICLHRSIKLHDAGRRFQLVVPWSVRPY